MTEKLDIALANLFLGKFPYVLGVGYGLKETEGKTTQQLAWRVYVREKKPLCQLGPEEIIPTYVCGLNTDVIVHAPTFSCTTNLGVRLCAGAKIANSKGVPGTLGCIAKLLPDGCLVLLSNWHVLFGNGAQQDSALWLVDETKDTRRFIKIGKTLYGKIGTIQLDGENYYVDCAVGSCLQFPDTSPEQQSNQSIEEPFFIKGHDNARLDQCVRKIGTATGLTFGIVVDITYPDFVWIDGRGYCAPQQLLIKPVDGQAFFSAVGDSGSIIINGENKAVGLLWGTNSRGEGVASHIAPVLQVMNITLKLPSVTNPAAMNKVYQ